MNLSTESNDLLLKLSARLPELEWKIGQLGLVLSSNNLPKGLFRYSTELNGKSCIKEIKEELQLLSQQKNKLSALYLAERIRQKINVLVILCKMHQQKDKQEENAKFRINKIHSRQQWLNDIQNEINKLTEQQQAMIETLEDRKTKSNPSMILQLKTELGAVERRLTLAKEALSHAFAK